MKSNTPRVTQFSCPLVHESASGVDSELCNRGANFDKRRRFGHLDKCTGLLTGIMKSLKQRLKKNEVNNIDTKYKM